MQTQYWEKNNKLWFLGPPLGLLQRQDARNIDASCLSRFQSPLLVCSWLKFTIGFRSTKIDFKMHLLSKSGVFSLSARNPNLFLRFTNNDYRAGGNTNVSEDEAWYWHPISTPTRFRNFVVRNHPVLKRRGSRFRSVSKFPFYGAIICNHMSS